MFSTPELCCFSPTMHSCGSVVKQPLIVSTLGAINAYVVREIIGLLQTWCVLNMVCSPRQKFFLDVPLG